MIKKCHVADFKLLKDGALGEVTNGIFIGDITFDMGTYFNLNPYTDEDPEEGEENPADIPEC